MKGIKGWFRRNNTIVAQAKDLSRRLREAWGDAEDAERLYINECATNAGLQTDIDYLREQLHRVARERDAERKKRIDAEMLTMEFIRKKRLAAEDALLDKYVADKTWEEMVEELRDIGLEEAENEEE